MEINTLTQDTMKSSLPVAKINGNIVHGQAHIQPGVNRWIGVCIIDEELLDYNPENLESVIIDYEGPFNCRKFQTSGKGKAKLLAVSPAIQKNKVTITFEGVEKAQLERQLVKDLCHSYDENLPVYINNKKQGLNKKNKR